ncbi:MAG: GNAT family N-acetyltransferase [Nitrosomonas sp.]|nr:GNAT family N-acetyltransferase [Nitrosomonas sp.]
MRKSGAPVSSTLGIERNTLMTKNVATKMNRGHRSSIRRSKPDDLDAIHNWLIDEEAQGVHGNFLCNWSIIERAHRDGELLVYVGGRTGLPLAFQLGGLIRPGILQVRHAYRGTGIGRKMVQRCISLASKRDQCLLYIECKPSTSIPFWQRMGFTLIESANGKNYSYQIIDKPLQLSEQGVAVAVLIRFFPESRKWEPNTKPYAAFSPPAKLTLNGTIYLAHRVQFHEEVFPDVHDVVVEIEVEGSNRYSDKAKYDDARKIGVTRCINGYYIDVVHPA